MEKYGEIPPRFTKAWWGYFWEYYKWYVIGGAFVIILVAVWLFQCTHRPKYDMTVVYSGHMNYSEAEQKRLCEIASEYTPDIDDNGESAVYFQSLVFSDGAGNESFDYAVQTKLDLTFIDDYTFIYLMDEIEAKLFMQRDTIADMFENTDLYASDANSEILRGDADGAGYAVSLKDSKLLKENDINSDDLYLMVKVNPKADEKNIKSHEGAIEFAKALTE